MNDTQLPYTRADVAATDERAHLVRLCRHLTGDAHAAEDLAHETLLEAWRLAHKLHDPAARPQWLAAIARNVCRRWRRRRSVELARTTALEAAQLDCSALQVRAVDADPELHLEQRDRVIVLRHALARLPAMTRVLLVERYLHAVPHAELAHRHGLTEPVVWMRINRGKRLLKQVLTAELLPHAAMNDWGAPKLPPWQETRIWCSGCGRHRLLGRFVAGYELELDCPQCIVQTRLPVVRSRLLHLVTSQPAADVLAGLASFKPAMTRLYRQFHAFYAGGIAAGAARCPACTALAPLHVVAVADAPGHDVQIACSCGTTTAISTVSGIALMRPEGQAFATTHGRIRTLPDRVVEADGAPAIVTTHERVDGAAAYAVVFNRATLRVVAVQT